MIICFMRHNHIWIPAICKLKIITFRSQEKVFSLLTTSWVTWFILKPKTTCVTRWLGLISRDTRFVCSSKVNWRYITHIYLNRRMSREFLHLSCGLSYQPSDIVNCSIFSHKEIHSSHKGVLFYNPISTILACKVSHIRPRNGWNWVTKWLRLGCKMSETVKQMTDCPCFFQKKSAFVWLFNEKNVPLHTQFGKQYPRWNKCTLSSVGRATDS